MYAIIQVGPHQYKIAEGDIIATDRLTDDKDKDVTLDQVLLFANGEDVRVGQPYLTDVKVTAKVVEHTQGKKVISFKYRIRKDSATKRGHRRQLTALNITKITAK